MFLYIGGVRGVGKSTVSKEVGKVLNQTLPTTVIGGCQAMCDQTDLSPKEAYELPTSLHDYYIGQARANRSRLDSDQVLTIEDIHYAYFESAKHLNKNHYVSRSVCEYERRHVIGLIYLTAPTKVILERRLTDQSRLSHRSLSEQAIDYEKSIQCREAIAQAGKLERPIRIIDNLDLETTVLKICRFFHLQRSVKLRKEAKELALF